MNEHSLENTPLMWEPISERRSSFDRGHRRTECGSHVVIFMLRGASARGIRGSYENARLGSHADRAFCGKRGLVNPAKCPRLAATAVANALTVATNAIFINRVDLNGSWGSFMKRQFSGAPRGRGVSISLETGRPRPARAFSLAVASLKSSWGSLLRLIAGFMLFTLFFSIPGSGQVRDRQSLVRDLEGIARVATVMIDGDVCQHIMTERALKKIFELDPRDPFAGGDNFDVNAEPSIQTKKVLMRLARLVSYPVDCNLWMPFKAEPGKIQVLIRNKYEMSQFWSFGQLYLETPAEMKEVLTTGKPLTVQKRGDFISVLTPVYDSLDGMVGLVEVVSRLQPDPEENVK